MKKWVVGGLLWLGLVGGRALAAEAPPAELLARLAEQESRVGKVLKAGAYRVTSHIEERDGGGKLLQSREVVTRISHPEGRRTVQVEKVVVDGKDVTETERSKEQDRTARELQSPFSAAAQSKYRFTLVGPDEVNPSRLRIRFEPKEGERSSRTYIGEALVDPVAGEVVWMRERPAENPNFVSRLEVEVELSTVTPAGRQMAWLRVEGTAGLLFYKRGFKVRLAFSDYDVTPATR